MKNKTLYQKIRGGAFDPSKKFQFTIDSIRNSYGRAVNNIENMHSEDEITLEESLVREFRAYARHINAALENQLKDEKEKMNKLRYEFEKIFGVDMWDEVILNYTFDTLEQFYDTMCLHYKENYGND